MVRTGHSIIRLHIVSRIGEKGKKGNRKREYFFLKEKNDKKKASLCHGQDTVSLVPCLCCCAIRAGQGQNDGDGIINY